MPSLKEAAGVANIEDHNLNKSEILNKLLDLMELLW